MYCTGRCAKSNKLWLILVYGNKENPLIANSLITQASCVLLAPGTTYFKYKLQNDPERLKALMKSARGETWVLSLPFRTEPFPGFSSSMRGWSTRWSSCALSHWIHVCNTLCGQQLAPAQNEVSKKQHFISDIVHGNVIYFHPAACIFFYKS